MRVLLVEDDERYGQALRVVLDGLAGLVLVQTTTLYGALAVLGNDPSLGMAVVDLALPDASGIEAVRVIRSQFPDLTVVVLTANDEPSVREAALAAGAVEYLLKGKDEPRLQTVIDAALGGRQAMTPPRG